MTRQDHNTHWQDNILHGKGALLHTKGTPQVQDGNMQHDNLSDTKYST